MSRDKDAPTPHPRDDRDDDERASDAYKQGLSDALKAQGRKSSWERRAPRPQ